ncbi:esterase/lipase [Albidovulum inexpectatum]|uniref:Esterase/lipase n=1 Tax=Albidovulum inexpectatum TaxID=196587 RepID=A0A2S5JFN9_9RHOB|nr:alpha/beta hydrolase [Albidovulum inexpectatum]PPB80178.1 esterase/lipase [Albidovulum inexpectatum]
MLRVTAWGLVVLAVAIGVLFAVGPREPLDLHVDFDDSVLPDDPAALDRWLATRESVVGGIVPGAEKRIVWDGVPGQVTDWAVVYLHGFSATAQEIRPVPDLVARALGANLFFTRFAGHGLGSERFAGPTANDWMIDAAEALAIGKRLGKRVLVIATSTGGTIAAEAALQPELRARMDALVFVSPNFGIRAAASRILTWPYARKWVPIVAGRERCFEPQNEDHARFWTTCYPTVALLPMAALAEHAASADYAGVDLPALFVFSPNDMVVSPDATRKVAARWGGPVRVEEVTVGPDDDPFSHVIAGDILSPGMTDTVTDLILSWVRGL